jgi:hypothetical protein
MRMRHDRAKARKTSRLVLGVLVCSWLCLARGSLMAESPQSRQSAQSRQPPSGSAAFRTIEKGTQSNIDSPRQAVARTTAEWTALWKAHNFDKPAPSVDFDREMAAAVFMGSRPTGGFSVEIVSAEERDGSFVVGYRESSPRADAVTVQILTAPYHIVAVPKHGGPVKFEKK